MLVHREIENFSPSPARPLFLAIGNFDGVHLGHQNILRRVAEDAKRCNGTAAVFTFPEHPQKILHTGQGPLLLSPVEQKIFLLEKFGIEVCFLQSFTEAFSKLEAEDFVQKILCGYLKVKKVYMGYNARFGHGRKGDGDLMRTLAEQYGFEFEKAAPVEITGNPVSSSRIRWLVEAGEFEKAAECLGRPWSFFAKVIHGQGHGAGLGYPTANFDMSGRVLPPLGVYPMAVRKLDVREKKQGDAFFLEINPEGSWMMSAANCGYRPTIHPEAKEIVLESFILDQPGIELYGSTLEVLFYPRLRGERAFSTKEELQKQISCDIEAVRDRFKAFFPSS